jgi:hypothetical protein
MLLLWPGQCYLYAALCLLLWPGLCGSSMVWTVRLPMLASMIHLWATIRGKSFPVTNSLLHASMHKMRSGMCLPFGQFASAVHSKKGER